MALSLNQFQYNLPDERIAKYPLTERDSSKLLVYNAEKKLLDLSFRQLPEALPQNSLLVFNNTKVIQSRLILNRSKGARVEIFLLEPTENMVPEVALLQKGKTVWNCMAGNTKRIKPEEELIADGGKLKLKAKLVEPHRNAVELTWEPQDYTLAEVLDHFGKIPLPPYLNRDAEEADKETYQTIFAKNPGAVAAPTASLHFTASVVEALASQGHLSCELTLHVGAGTFAPVKTENIDEHKMHEELIDVPLSTLKTLAAHKGPIVPVGTTSLRTLETVYWAGNLLLQGHNLNELQILQTTPYQAKAFPRKEALAKLIEALEQSHQEHWVTNTQIMVRPGYNFGLTDALVTNFHQPGSTLIMLIASIVGIHWKKIYQHALENEYRFLSYGDSSLLFCHEVSLKDFS